MHVQLWRLAKSLRILDAMKTQTAIAALLTLVTAPLVSAAPPPAAPATGTEVGQHIPAFTAQVVDVSKNPPKTSDFDSAKQDHVTAYIFVGTTCPATAAYSDRFKELERAYGKKGVVFLYIYPNRNDSRDQKLAFHQQRQFAGRLIDDQDARLAHLFQAKRTSELFLTDEHGVIIYHGAVDDSRDPQAVKQHYLATALDEHIAGKPVTVASSDVFA